MSKWRACLPKLGRLAVREAVVLLCAAALGLGWSLFTAGRYLPTMDGSVYAMDPTDNSLFMVLSKDANNSLVHIDYGGNLLHFAVTETNEAFENLVVLEDTIYAVRTAYDTGKTTQALVTWEDTQSALRQRGGALEFGVHYAVSVTPEDMVLPEHIQEQLRDICTAARCGPALAAWGVPTLREGVTAVFHGPSGTGKTMAASAIAGDLKMPLLRADLSRIMDKYVGETEKHLGRLMRCAKENRCVLLFDEADALFGKRASVSTGHDKFANLSTSFLLQEIEQYDGVAILSTNLLNSFDDAFLRRLHYIVRFRLPDAPLREELWRRALPPSRLEGEIPFDALAQAELSPARINGVARAAAVSAMAAGRETISLPILGKALCLELEKSGKALPRQLSGLTERAGDQC